MGSAVTLRARGTLRTLLSEDDGSTLPLILGYVLLAIAVTFTCVCATDLYIAQKRLDSLADSAALAGSDGYLILFDGAGGARAELTDGGVREQAESIIATIGGPATLLYADTPDGTSARVTVGIVWHPPLFSPFVPDGVALESTATSRTALQ